MMARRALIARGAFAARGMPRSFRCHARAGGASTVLACCIFEARNSLEPFGSLDAVIGERLPSGKCLSCWCAPQNGIDAATDASLTSAAV